MRTEPVAKEIHTHTHTNNFCHQISFDFILFGITLGSFIRERNACIECLLIHLLYIHLLIAIVEPMLSIKTKKKNEPTTNDEAIKKNCMKYHHNQDEQCYRHVLIHGWCVYMCALD